MIIRNPVNPYPQNITVDLNESMEFVFSGDRLGSYKIRIYSYSIGSLETETLVYQSNEFIVLDEYAYNNTKITLEKNLEEMGLENKKSYTWEIIMSPNKNETKDESCFFSLRYFFETSPIPTITTAPDNETVGFLINKEEYPYDLGRPLEVEIDTRIIDINGYYSSDNIKYYYFQLEDEDNNIIEKTEKTFSSKISYKFSGLVSFKNYKLYLFAISQKDQRTNIIFNIKVNYTPKSNLAYPPIITCDENETSIKIKWVKDETAGGEPSGEYYFEKIGNSETNKGVVISSGEIVYDNISSLPINMDESNFSVGVKTIVNDNTTKIFDYVNNNWLYEVYIKDYKFYLKGGHINSQNKQIEELGSFKENIMFGIQPNNEPSAHTGYMWYIGEDDQGREYSIDYSDTSYILISQEEQNFYSMILQGMKTIASGFEFKCEIEKQTTNEE